MSVISGTRVSSTMLAQMSSQNINRNLNQMLDLQTQLSTGLRLYKASIDPAGSGAALTYQKLISQNGQYSSNIDQASTFLTDTDSALSNVQDLLNQIQSIASTDIGSGSDNQTRQNNASLVGTLINQLVQIGNSQSQGRYLFAGQAMQQTPFSLSDTGISFTGDNQQMSTQVSPNSNLAYNVTAGDVFGSLSASVTGTNELNPLIDNTTRLCDLNGGAGLHLGSMVISNGTASTTVDLSHCDNLVDVCDALSNNGVVPVAVAANGSGNGLEIIGGVGDTLSVADVNGGKTAEELGLPQIAPMLPGIPLIGGDLNPKLTPLTQMTALNIDQLNGFKITVGSQTATVDLSTANTFQDVLNAINQCGLPVKASIDSTSNRLVVANQVASEPITIGENGGTTAADLGIRTMDLGTTLSSLNGGKGVQDASGNDFEISTRSGSTIDVDVNGLTTVGDVLTAINTNAANGGKVTASLNTDGNGICLTDSTVGANNFKVTALNNSTAAGDLGIAQTVANPATTIYGDDVAPVMETGAFQALYALQNALESNDSSAISAAGTAIENQISAVARVRGTVGAKLQALTQAKTDNQNETLQLTSTLSTVRDTDYATATAQLQSLQTAFQASLQVAANVLPTTLMNFLK